MFNTDINVNTKQAAEMLALQKAMSEHKGKALIMPLAENCNDEYPKCALIWSGLVVGAESVWDYDKKEQTYIVLLGQQTIRVALPLKEVLAKIS